jgi:hypothetical protein
MRDRLVRLGHPVGVFFLIDRVASPLLAAITERRKGDRARKTTH